VTLFYLEQEEFDAMMDRLPGVRKQLEEAAGRRSKVLGLSRYDWQEADEIVLWMAQRNIVPQFFESLGGLIFWHFIAGVLAVVSFVPLPLIGMVSLTWQWALRIAAFLIVSLVWIWYMVDWTNDYLVLTNRRIVHVERYGILRETRSEIPIRAVQNVDMARGWPTSFLGLSDITIKTIGGTLTFEHIADAEHLQSRILDQRNLALQATRHEDRDEIRQTLLKVLKPQSLAEPLQPQQPPDALSALPQVKPKAPARPPLSERLRSLRQMRQVKGDEITWRKHWLVLLGRLTGPIILLLIGSLLSLFTWWLPKVPTSAPQISTFITTILVLAIPAALLWGWWEFLVWGGDVYTLSSNRIIDIERLPLGLREKRRESNLDRIQDIDVDIPNILARAFGMGDVYIKTGAAGSDLTFHDVADPYGVQRDIFHQLAKLRRTEERQRRAQTMEEITRWLAVYNELTTKTTKS
jgi:uncharacterized membrane protein YdbT with pleckstrin-like domain